MTEQLIHVKNLEKFHPGYKDRTLQWAKIYFRMVQGDPDCEMIENEIDWARLIKFILLELEAQKPLPLNEKYLKKKGFDLRRRSIALTLQMLHNFVEVVNTESKTCVLDKDKEEDKEEEKEEYTVTEIHSIIDFMNNLWETHYRYDSDTTTKLIHARFKEGFTANDFFLVIQKMTNQWKTDPKMSPYLRPQTLFSNKFESYLNQIKPEEKSAMQNLVEETISKYGQENGV